MPLESTDGTFTIGRDTFPDFGRWARLGVHIQSDRVRVARPDPEYVQAALDALDEACRQLDIPEASIVFVDTVEPPPAVGLRYGFKGSYTTDYPTIIWVFANWTRLDELREVVRHEAAHLAFARTHTAEESAGHSGPSEDFALAFERQLGIDVPDRPVGAPAHRALREVRESRHSRSTHVISPRRTIGPSWVTSRGARVATRKSDITYAYRK